MEAEASSDSIPDSQRRARDLQPTDADRRREADMLAEGGGVLEPAVPVSTPLPKQAANEPPSDASSSKSPKGVLRKARHRWEAKLRDFSKRQLANISRQSDRQSRLELVADRVRLTANQATLAIELLEDYRTGKYREISWASLAALVAMVAYLVNPADVIPDVLPVLGQLDDAVALQLAVLVLRRDLRRYCEFKGYIAANYFGS